MRQNKENGFKPHFKRFFSIHTIAAMRYRKGGTRQKNAHAARRNVCAIVRAVYVLCTFCFLPLVLLVLRNSLICSHACFTLTFCSFTFCFIPRTEAARHPDWSQGLPHCLSIRPNRSMSRSDKNWSVPDWWHKKPV